MPLSARWRPASYRRLYYVNPREDGRVTQHLHGSKTRYAIGDRIRPGLVNPNDDDNRMKVWSTTDLDEAKHWAEHRYSPTPCSSGSAYVYEVDMDADSLEQDANLGGEHSWMSDGAVVTAVLMRWDPTSQAWLPCT